MLASQGLYHAVSSSQAAMKDKVDITGMTWQEVVALVNCSKTTAKNALKRGYYVVNYKKRICIPGPIDAEGCYKMAWFTFERFFGITAHGTLPLKIACKRRSSGWWSWAAMRGQ